MTENMEATMLRSSGSLRKEDRRKEDAEKPSRNRCSSEETEQDLQGCDWRDERHRNDVRAWWGGHYKTEGTVCSLSGGWRDDGVVTNTALPDDGGSIPRTLHGKSEPSVTKVPGIKYPLWPRRHCMCMVHKHTCGQHTRTLTIKCGVGRFLEATL